MNTNLIDLKIKYSDLYEAFNLSRITFDKAKFEYIFTILNNMPIKDVHEIKSEIPDICWIALSIQLHKLSDSFIIECINSFYWKLALTNYINNSRLLKIIDKCRNKLSVNTLDDIKYMTDYEIKQTDTTNKVE